MADLELFEQLVSELEREDASLISHVVAKYMAMASDPAKMISNTHFRWFNGNIAHFITIMIVNPHMTLRDPLTLVQQRDAIFTLFKLAMMYDLDLSKRDACQQTPLEFLERHKDCVQTDETVVELLSQVLTDAQLLKMKQVFMIKRFLLKRRIRRQRAADLIGKRVMEYVMNPYTPVGERLLHRRAERWYKMA